MSERNLLDFRKTHCGHILATALPSSTQLISATKIVEFQEMVFCCQNCSDLLREKNCSSDREKLFLSQRPIVAIYRQQRKSTLPASPQLISTPKNVEFRE